MRLTACIVGGCCCYHKGRNFQANHNKNSALLQVICVVVATTKVGIFKQITTTVGGLGATPRCCCYHKGRNFQANHNQKAMYFFLKLGCCCYHKGRNFQANHNYMRYRIMEAMVVVATTKVGIFKQITTEKDMLSSAPRLLLLPQR